MDSLDHLYTIFTPNRQTALYRGIGKCSNLKAKLFPTFLTKWWGIYNIYIIFESLLGNMLTIHPL